MHLLALCGVFQVFSPFICNCCLLINCFINHKYLIYIMLEYLLLIRMTFFKCQFLLQAFQFYVITCSVLLLFSFLLELHEVFCLCIAYLLINILWILFFNQFPGKRFYFLHASIQHYLLQNISLFYVLRSFVIKNC